VGEVGQLICPEGVTVIGASSDHLVVDVQERPGLQAGDGLTFRLFYQGMLYAFQSVDVEKVYVE
jgi:predicted amino acid racemase